VQCRRKALLEYFGEDFDARFCQNKCDICRASNGVGSSSSSFAAAATGSLVPNILNRNAPAASSGSNNHLLGMQSSASSSSSGLNMTTAERDAHLRQQEGLPPARTVDMTKEAKIALMYFRDCASCELTVAKLRDALAGLNLPKAPQSRRKGRRKVHTSQQYQRIVNQKRDTIMGHRSFGSLKQQGKGTCENLLRSMITAQVLIEETVSNSSFTAAANTGRGGRRKKRRGGRAGKFSWNILKMGPRSSAFLNSPQPSIQIMVETVAAAGSQASGVSVSSSRDSTDLEDDIETSDSDEETSDSEVLAAIAASKEEHQREQAVMHQLQQNEVTRQQINAKTPNGALGGPTTSLASSVPVGGPNMSIGPSNGTSTSTTGFGGTSASGFAGTSSTTTPGFSTSTSSAAFPTTSAIGSSGSSSSANNATAGGSSLSTNTAGLLGSLRTNGFRNNSTTSSAATSSSRINSSATARFFGGISMNGESSGASSSTTFAAFNALSDKGHAAAQSSKNGAGKSSSFDAISEDETDDDEKLFGRGPMKRSAEQPTDKDSDAEELAPSSLLARLREKRRRLSPNEPPKK
ncbi:unnamed protein product, partial [Amoebophrya sp. A25]